MVFFLKKNARHLKSLILVAVMGIPFLLYIAAVNDQIGLVYLLLGAMGLCMLVAMKAG